MLRGSDLSQMRNQIIAVAKEVASPKQKEYFSLIFEEGVSPDEVARAYNLAGYDTIYSTFHQQLKPKIIKSKPFLASTEALKYKGAARILKMLAIQCDRRNEAHDENEFSYSQLFHNVNEIVDEEATDIQKIIYKKYFVDGKSQVQIASEAQRGQPSVWKNIFGNYDTKHGKVYGGIVSKVGKHLNSRGIPYCCHLIEPYGGLFQLIFGKY